MGFLVMGEVEPQVGQVEIPVVLQALLHDFSAIIDYRTLQDSLPRRLATLMRCRCALFYQRIGETLQFVAGSFDDQPGWSVALLSVARINPIQLTSDFPEARAWRERHACVTPESDPTHVAVPLIYRQRCIGVMVLIRQPRETLPEAPTTWNTDEIRMVEAIGGVVALLLENTRLLERDRERIHELALLNSISSQMHYSMYEYERMRSVIVQRTREISMVDLCALLEPPVAHARGRARQEPWVSEQLRALLWRYFDEQKSPEILLLEYPDTHKDEQCARILRELPDTIKTFFALPLLAGKIGTWRSRSGQGVGQEYAHEANVIGIVVGGYHTPWKLRKSELVLLQVLASQAGAALENMSLMTEVIEARNEARKLLRQVLEDQRLKEIILESIPSGLITVDHEGRITTFNRAASAILGYHAREALGQPLVNILDLRSLQAFPVRHESIHTETLHDISLDEGLPEETEREIVTSQLEETEAFDALLKALHGGMVGAGERNDQPQVTESLRSAAHSTSSALASDGRRSGTVKMTDRQGRDVVLEVDALPLSDEASRPIGTLITFTDVTSMHRLEEEKRRLDRLATLGEMAANVAHEVRNPLASIKTSMQMIMEELASGTEALESDEVSCSLGSDQAWIREESAVVLKEVERLNTIVHDLLLFARPRQLHRIPCDLRELSDRVLHFIQAQCEATNVVVHRVYRALPPVEVDVGQMEQVLLNLYMNALQAMAEGGILTVSCMTLPVEDAPVNDAHEDVTSTLPRHVLASQQRERTRRQWVEISVSDTGEGIRPEQLERIFQPFFTTKAHGIGLGLAITRRLVEDHGGYIRVEGHYGYGATISIRLPISGEEGISRYPRHEEETHVMGEETFVEEVNDEPGHSHRG